MKVSAGKDAQGGRMQKLGSEVWEANETEGNWQKYKSNQEV